MQTGRWDIEHPAVGASVTPDALLVPLVGFDAGGWRLGYGGGFYDRALRFRHTRRHWPGPKLVGLAFQCQRADSVFAEPHDVRLDAVATERGVQHFSKEDARE